MHRLLAALVTVAMVCAASGAGAADNPKQYRGLFCDTPKQIEDFLSKSKMTVRQAIDEVNAAAGSDDACQFGDTIATLGEIVGYVTAHGYVFAIREIHALAHPLPGGGMMIGQPQTYYTFERTADRGA